MPGCMLNFLTMVKHLDNRTNPRRHAGQLKTLVVRDPRHYCDVIAIFLVALT